MSVAALAPMAALPRKAVAKRYEHAFVVHTHADARQVERLVRTLRQTCPNTFIVISHDHRSPSPPADLRSIPDSMLLMSPGAREGMPIVEAYLAALRWMEEQGITFSWVSNLSGQCYPSRSMRKFLNHCRGSDANAFIHHFDAFQCALPDMAPYEWGSNEGRLRYHYRYTKLAESVPWPIRAALRPLRVALDRAPAPIRLNLSYGLMVGRYCDQVPFSPSFRCMAGSHWHTLDASAAAVLLTVASSRPDLVAFFRTLLQSEEAFVQTILANDPSLRLINDNLRFIDMRDARHGRPRMFNETDVAEIIESGKYFIRKVDAHSKPLLDRLDDLAAS